MGFLENNFKKRIFGQISTKINKKTKTNTIGKKQSPLFISFSGPQEVMKRTGSGFEFVTCDLIEMHARGAKANLGFVNMMCITLRGDLRPSAGASRRATQTGKYVHAVTAHGCLLHRNENLELKKDSTYVFNHIIWLRKRGRIFKSATHLQRPPILATDTQQYLALFSCTLWFAIERYLWKDILFIKYKYIHK